MPVYTNDHEISIYTSGAWSTKRLTLIRQEGRALYQVTEEIPRYQDPLKFIQTDWIGGHGQFDFAQPDMYFEGQSIDTTQPGKVILGPLIYSVGISGGTLGANPVCFIWFESISKWLAATATRVFWYDGTDFVMKWDRANHAWAATHAFTTADWVRPTTYNGHIYECTTAGTGGGTEPTWGTTDAGTTTSGAATFTCRSITITDMKIFEDVLYVALGSTALYYYSSDAVTFTVTDLTDGYAQKFLVSPNPAGTADVFWKFKLPNKVTYTTNGQASGSQWSSDALIGDKSNDIINIFLIADNFMVGKEDNLFHYDSNGGLHPLRPDLKWNRSTDNFKYVTDWQTCTYFSEIRGMGEITQTLAYEPMGPLTNIDDIDKRGTIIGLTSDKDWLYIAVDEGTNTHIYKSREVRGAGGLRWEYCPFISFVSATYPCATMKVCQHSTTDKRLWFGYANNAGYVILSDNPLADSSYKFTTTSGSFVRMSYIVGSNRYWDKMWQSVVTQTEDCATGITVTPYYRKDTDTSAATLTAAISTNGTVKTPLTAALSCNRIQFQANLVTNDSAKTPQLLYFEARGTEKPETVRIHECTYAIGDTPSKRAETIRTFLRGGRTSTSLIKFADLRYQGPTPTGTTSTDYVWVILLPGSPTEVEILHERDKSPELGIRVRFQEVNFTVS